MDINNSSSYSSLFNAENLNLKLNGNSTLFLNNRINKLNNNIN